MKRVYIFLMLGLLLQSSCSDFLKEENNDEVIPRTVDHFFQVMHREAFIQNMTNYLTDFMTDDIVENRKTSTNEKNLYKSLYTWQRNIEVDGNGDNSSVNRFWESLYRLVLITNYVMENIDNAIGESSEKAYAAGEAYFVRARCYFELVNLYAKHYDPETAATEPGVPLRLGTGIVENYTRASVGDIYELVENDLKTAIGYFEQSGLKKSLWHPNAATAKLLLSRVYLYKSDWENCITYSSQVIDGTGGMLWNLNEHDGTFVNTTNPEILHVYGETSSLIQTGEYATPDIYGGTNVTYGVSSDMQGVFLSGDLRPDICIKTVLGIGVPYKWFGTYTDLGGFNFRVSEAYLNRAEAYASLNRDEEAYADVKKLVENRVRDMNQITIPSTGLELKRFIFNERRRELCYEGHRWYDLKRTKLFAKQIDHVFTLVNSTGAIIGTETYMLMANDPNYVYPIPQKEMDANGSMSQNERVDKLPIKEDY